MRKAYLVLREDTLALMEAHRNCFREVGHPRVILAIDNMRTAVKKFSSGDREHTVSLLRMRLHYCFTTPFLQPPSGIGKKARVERSVGYIRSPCILVARSGLTPWMPPRRSIWRPVCDRLNTEASNMSGEEKTPAHKGDLGRL